jgi:D-apiose dehydrogenase
VTTLRFAIFGAGFWSRFQLAAWQELEGAECIAIYNRTRAKAEDLAARAVAGGPAPTVYDDAEALLDNEQLDFIDIITDVDTHSKFVHLAAERGLPVICQKPMGPSLEVAHAMVNICDAADVPFYIHENWRWQLPLREFKAALDARRIGIPFRARIHYCSSFPVFKNQPFLAELDQFILTDIGSHILDVARFLFGEASTLYCQTHHVHRDLKHEAVRGEDVATTVMTMGEGITVTCEMSYASRTEIEVFPQTYVYVEGAEGFLELGPNYWIRETTADGTRARRVPPPRYAWADPEYDLIHASIVPCNADLLQALQGQGQAETTGADNLKTMQLVFSSYESAATGQVLQLTSAAAP